MPSATGIRTHLAVYAATEAPETLRALAAAAVAWSDKELQDGFAEVYIAARCFSGGQAGPVNPGNIPPDEVKAWGLAVLERAPPPVKALKPLLSSVPASAWKTGWLHAVELRRGLDYGSLKGGPNV